MKRAKFRGLLGLVVLALTGSMLIGQGDQDTRRRSDRDQGEFRERSRGAFSSEDRQHLRAAIQQRIAERLRERLNLNDEEAAVLQPHIEKVVKLQFSMRGRSGRGFGNRGRRNRPSPERPGGAPGAREAGQPEPSAVQQSADALRELLDGDNKAANEQITEALTALRKAREAAQVELEKAQQELRDLVTLEQEARLVIFGILR